MLLTNAVRMAKREEILWETSADKPGGEKEGGAGVVRLQNHRNTAPRSLHQIPQTREIPLSPTRPSRIQRLKATAFWFFNREGDLFRFAKKGCRGNSPHRFSSI